MRWFRFYTEALDDPKVQRLPCELFKHWVNLLCLAGRYDGRGRLPPMADIAFGLRMSEEQADRVCMDLCERDLLDYDIHDLSEQRYAIHGWTDRQPESDTPQAIAHRKRMQRKRDRMESRRSHSDKPVTVTPESRKSHALETETEIETETEGTADARTREDPTPPHLSLVPAANGNGKTQPLPARRDRTSAAIRDQLAQVHAELAEGSRTRLKAQQQRSVAAGMVFAYWASITNSERSLLDDKRERLIIARLMENGGDVFELLYACDGALRDPWHNGEKDQTRRMGIEQILRNRGKVEELAGKVPGYRKGEAHRMAEKYATIFNTEHAA